MNPSRRKILERGAAVALTAMAQGIFAPRVSFAAPATGSARFVFVLLRGALDGLAVVPPVGDDDYRRLRGEQSLHDAPGLVPLDDLFALHPAMPFTAAQWTKRQLSVIHAVATPYRDRSHFDAQDVLESGFARPHASRSGWMNRALAALPLAGRSGSAQKGVALGASIPLLMRGRSEVSSWSPGRMPGMGADTLQRLTDLYAGDALLARRLAEALTADALAGESGMSGAGRAGAMQLAQTATTAAAFLKQEAGPRVAVFETTGWDTHANQGADKGALAARLATLDAGLAALAEGLGSVWQHTVVLVATEFGRTVAINGTRGTDHGTGAAALLLGGAVRGRVIADWPGLAAQQLHEGRDLQATLDLRSVMKSVLRDHLQLPARFIDSEVFPDSSAARYINDLV